MGSFLYDITCSIVRSLHRSVVGRAGAREGGKEEKEEEEGRRNKEQVTRNKEQRKKEKGRWKMDIVLGVATLGHRGEQI